MAIIIADYHFGLALLGGEVCVSAAWDPGGVGQQSYVFPIREDAENLDFHEAHEGNEGRDGVRAPGCGTLIHANRR